MIHVIARMELHPGCQEKILEVMRKLVPIVRAEAGCISYTPCVDVKPETRELFVTIVETWESEAHLKAHLDSRHMADYRIAVKDLRVGNTVNVVTPVL